MLRREKNALGFNIVGGLANQGSQVESAEGIYVSRIVENGPADKAEGLQINDKIIEEYTSLKEENHRNGGGIIHGPSAGWYCAGCYTMRFLVAVKVMQQEG